MKEIRIYTDGSGNTFNSDGGWAYVIVERRKDESEWVLIHGSGYLKKATNNSAEITAAIEGLKAYILNRERWQGDRSTDVSICDTICDKNQVILVSDSQLVLGYATGRYKCKATHLVPLYLELRKLYQSTEAKDEWVRGHSGNVFNEECDKLAGAARLSKGV